MSRKWARKCERYCCIGATYFPLLFVYSLTSWAVWVEATIGFLQAKTTWTGTGTSLLGIALFILLNWSYTTAVFTSPGTTTSRNGYSTLPTNAPPAATNFTVKSNGELRFCKKCQARKPDRAHHCSTCKTCVLKMDHHCPWLATCVGLRNYKAFLLFLIYTTLFCFVDFAVSGYWVYREILTEGEYTDALMPINYVMLAVISGIIGLVLAGFTGWHILLASRGQTTIECLETTRYLSPLRKQHQHMSQSSYEQQQRDMNGEPGQSHGDQGQRHESYDALERFRARERYEAYLDEQDSDKLPSAFDLGRKRNLQHLFGPSKLLWFFPICNTTGDGWSWDASPKWLEAREKIAREREEQRQREHAAGWGAEPSPQIPPVRDGAGRHYVSYPNRTQSKADRLLGRNPDDYSDDSVPMNNLRLRDPEDQYDISSDEDEADRRALDRKATHGWPQRVGVVTNTLLGNTLARQKDDVRGWDGIDDGVD
ncbi:DHHC palmitoyltransferase-domain-containing protein [Rhexocercosporidium sp. MPI-PUGE-AT-0058]|nr:DHHC palmitoyltransferase-domain-containing protein [Rhexocercosporidium sp. MPI-PUGE-AT-0058]